MDGQTDKQIDGQTDGQVDGWTDKTDRWTGGRMDRWTDRQTDSNGRLLVNTSQLSLPAGVPADLPSSIREGWQPSGGRTPPPLQQCVCTVRGSGEAEGSHGEQEQQTSTKRFHHCSHGTE